MLVHGIFKAVGIAWKQLKKNHCICLGMLCQAGKNLQPVPREDQEEDD